MSFNSTIPRINKKLENILIIGSGGRENSLGWAIQKNELIKKIYISPGNAGSEKIKKCSRIDLNTTDKKDLIKKIKPLEIDLVVIGPEIPLAEGLGDYLRKSGYDVFGPNQDGARLEFSKSWAKEFMKNANIPTSKFWKVDSYYDAKKVIINSKEPLVVKADGLASGKGVFIPESKNECLQATKDIFNGKFGKSGQKVVLEDKIQGPEV